MHEILQIFYCKHRSLDRAVGIARTQRTGRPRSRGSLLQSVHIGSGTHKTASLVGNGDKATRT